MNYEVKELEIGGILDYTIRLYKDNFKFILTVVGTVIIPISVIWAVIQTAMMPNISPEAYAGLAQEEMTELMSSQLTGSLLTFVGVLITLVDNSVAQGALVHGMAHRFLGRDMSPSDSIRVGFRNLPRLIGASILMGLGIMGGSLLCIIPGIYLALAWYVVIPVLIFEGQPVGSIFGRSMKLMKGQMGKAFVLAFLLGIIGIAAAVFAQLVPGRYPSAILSSVINALLMGLNSVAVLVLYFSARCKAENFDVELLTQAVEGPGEEQGTIL